MTTLGYLRLGQPRPKSSARWALAAAGLALLGACSSTGEADKIDAGRADGASGGAMGPGSGGGPGASGGTNGSGGSSASGGAPGTGGANASGGANGTGGGGASGGRGGTNASGGAGGGRGGTNGTGGAAGAPPATGGNSGGGEFGFSYRKPAATDVDWLCTFRQGGVSGHVYARLNQTGTMMVGIATIPVYATALAQISVGGTPADLGSTQYDYGGGHHNDSFRFDYQGKTYKYYHSSFGFGFRSCQPMDCINVYESGATTPQTDGCTSARALPEICVPIKADGTHDPLTDRFMKCPGDSTPAAASVPSAQ